MSKASVLSLVDNLSANQAEHPAVERFYLEVVQTFAREPWIVAVTVLATQAGTSQYVLPDSLVKILAIFYDDRVLDRLDQVTAESMPHGQYWRDAIGIPLAYVVEDETAKTFRLYPKPAASSKDFTFLVGAPLGADYPEYACALIATEVRDDLPDWLDLPLALLVCEREFSRESTHRDDAFAQTCRAIANVLLGMVR